MRSGSISGPCAQALERPEFLCRTAETTGLWLRRKRSLPDRDWSRTVQDTEMQELFARLTAQFEDCAALAAEGQRAGLSQARAAELLREIRGITKRTRRSLSLVQEYLDGGH